MMVPGSKKSSSHAVRMKPLKEWASRKLPAESHLRQLILGEDDEMEVDEFLGRLPAWDGLARLEQQEGSV